MSDQSSRPLLILVDGHAVAYRAFFALRAPTFQTSEGEPTNATYGFTRLILDILDESPDYFAISFDRGLSGREELFEDYKGTREKMPDDLAIQLDRIDEVVRAFNIPVLAIDGYEADDIIGTVTKQAEAQGCEIRIVTGDKDLLQLVTEHTLVQLPQRGEPDKVYGILEFSEKYPGLTPRQLIDLKGLMGDSSDNIPGVKGIGEKGGLKLLREFGSLENIYENLDQIKGANHKKLTADRDMAFLSKELATIQLDVPYELDLDACVTHDYDWEVVHELFRKLQFRTFTRRLHKLNDINEAEIADTTEATTEVDIDIQVTIVDTDEKLSELVEKLNAASVIAFDTETTGTSQMYSNLVGISLAVDGEHGYYIPVGHIAPSASDDVTEGLPPTIYAEKKIQSGALVQGNLLDEPPPRQLDPDKVFEAIRPALTNPNIEKIAHNAKYDLILMRRYSIDVQPITHDTMIAEWLIDPASQNLGLKNMSSARLNIKMQPITELIGKGRKKITMARVDVEDAAKYAAADSAILFPLRESLSAELATIPASEELIHKMEMPLVPVIADMEMKGVLLDLPYLKDLSRELTERLNDIEQEIYTTCGVGEFNIRSLNQLSEVLFDKLQLSSEGLKKTKTGNWSLTADVLDSMVDEHPVIPMILDHRQLTKLLSTYVDALPALVNSYTGRVHTSFNQTGAATGRFSSSDPNLQNIPIRTEEGRRVRKAFIAPAGHVLLSVDYSQIELRILAHYSGDQALIEAFEKDRDIHASTAAAVHRIPIEEVTFEQRSFAKSVNFGLMYGMGAFRLARDSELTLAEARDFIEAYFERFPGVKKYLDESKEFAAEHGYVETLKGRRRNFQILQREAQGMKVSAIIRQRAEREAINMPIQGTASDIIKIAMIELAHELSAQNFEARMTLQVHDELVLEVPENELEKVVPLVVQTMESAMQLDVPIRADARVGKNWHEMTSYGVESLS